MRAGSELMNAPISQVVKVTEHPHQLKNLHEDHSEPNYDAIVDGINADTEKFAAQKSTPPLEEHFT